MVAMVTVAILASYLYSTKGDDERDNEKKMKLKWLASVVMVTEISSNTQEMHTTERQRNKKDNTCTRRKRWEDSPSL